MSTFGGLLFTNKGRNLQAKAQTGVQLKFTKIALGDGQLNGSAIGDLTNLKKLVVNLPIERLRTLSGGRAEVAGILSNQTLTSGFYYRELGLFALDPQEGEILYCYGNAGTLAEYIPASGGADVLEKQIVIQTIVGNATDITAVIDSSLVYATQSDMEFSIEQSLKASKEYTDTEITALEQLLTDLENKLGELTDLETEEKDNLVASINEIKRLLATHMAERASLTKVGHTQLSSATDSEDESKAITPKALKKTYDLAAAAIPKSEINKPGGVPGLDENGNIPKAQMTLVKRNEQGLVEYDLAGQDLQQFESTTLYSTKPYKFNATFNEITVDLRESRFMRLQFEVKGFHAGSIYNHESDFDITDLVDETGAVIMTVNFKIESSGSSYTLKSLPIEVPANMKNKVLRLRLRVRYNRQNTSNTVTSGVMGIRNYQIYKNAIES